jgi:hypothetical protein
MKMVNIMNLPYLRFFESERNAALRSQPTALKLPERQKKNFVSSLSVNVKSAAKRRAFGLYVSKKKLKI